jgi:hypothetical protein
MSVSKQYRLEDSIHSTNRLVHHSHRATTVVFYLFPWVDSARGAFSSQNVSCQTDYQFAELQKNNSTLNG